MRHRLEEFVEVGLFDFGLKLQTSLIGDLMVRIGFDEGCLFRLIDKGEPVFFDGAVF